MVSEAMTLTGNVLLLGIPPILMGLLGRMLWVMRQEWRWVDTVHAWTRSQIAAWKTMADVLAYEATLASWGGLPRMFSPKPTAWALLRLTRWRMKAVCGVPDGLWDLIMSRRNPPPGSGPTPGK